MLYNHNQLKKRTVHKTMHKRKKQWVVLSTAIFSILGAAGYATTTVNADTTTPTSASQDNPNSTAADQVSTASSSNDSTASVTTTSQSNNSITSSNDVMANSSNNSSNTQSTTTTGTTTSSSTNSMATSNNPSTSPQSVSMNPQLTATFAPTSTASNVPTLSLRDGNNQNNTNQTSQTNEPQSATNTQSLAYSMGSIVASLNWGTAKLDIDNNGTALLHDGNFDFNNHPNLSDQNGNRYNITNLQFQNAHYDSATVLANNDMESAPISDLFFNTKNIDFSGSDGWNNVKQFDDMFQNTPFIQTIKFGNNFDTSNATSMINMFSETGQNVSIDFGPKFVVGPNVSTNGMFEITDHGAWTTVNKFIMPPQLTLNANTNYNNVTKMYKDGVGPGVNIFDGQPHPGTWYGTRIYTNYQSAADNMSNQITNQFTQQSTAISTNQSIANQINQQASQANDIIKQANSLVAQTPPANNKSATSIVNQYNATLSTITSYATQANNITKSNQAWTQATLSSALQPIQSLSAEINNVSTVMSSTVNMMAQSAMDNTMQINTQLDTDMSNASTITQNTNNNYHQFTTQITNQLADINTTITQLINSMNLQTLQNLLPVPNNNNTVPTYPSYPIAPSNPITNNEATNSNTNVTPNQTNSVASNTTTTASNSTNPTISSSANPNSASNLPTSNSNNNQNSSQDVNTLLYLATSQNDREHITADGIMEGNLTNQPYDNFDNDHDINTNIAINTKPIVYTHHGNTVWLKPNQTLFVDTEKSIGDNMMAYRVFYDHNYITFTTDTNNLISKYYRHGEVQKQLNRTNNFTIQTLRPIRLHQQADFRDHGQHIKTGTNLTVQSISTYRHITRFTLSDGHIITSNKLFVKIIK